MGLWGLPAAWGWRPAGPQKTAQEGGTRSPRGANPPPPQLLQVKAGQDLLCSSARPGLCPGKIPCARATWSLKAEALVSQWGGPAALGLAGLWDGGRSIQHQEKAKKETGRKEKAKWQKPHFPKILLLQGRGTAL